ncbi:glycosyl hydrolase [Pseudonocardia sp. MH-G8]|uniref:glycosyl hydrolase n=1 Tax=Pseudonocardia sp. MH-G8 TaxID=1854588 RepID=UPI000BA1141A|nr:glycosyl hydrolase [Pseudonocardia sp. MH-G8]OZM78101.1 hypothetical protein CFP66_32630 [Pseudonocardia sp. MH-G8]
MIPELDALFDAPPPGFGPTPLWWWSAEPVTRERLEWQMHRFHEGGIDDLVVINLAPAGPLFGAVADDPPWFSDAWWDRFRDACAVARSLGMRLWFYDQIGFSGANIQGRITHEHPWATGRTLRATTTPATAGRVVLPGDAEPVAAYTADGRRVDVGADTEATELLLVTAHPTAFDYLSPAAVDLLLDTVHREFARRVPEYLGDVVVGSFQDELPATNAWTPRFAAEFAARTGYDLLDHLPALFGRPRSDEADLAAAKVRSDYYAVRAALTEEALFRPLARWHAGHGLLLGADQSNPARAGLPAQSTQIYTDYFRTHRWFSAVGSDHEGDAKVHSSMAHLYGHDRVWIEAFHSSGWGGTLEDTWDWLLPFLRSGATLYNPHASYYSTVGGWFEWAPPSTDWRQPYWRHYPAFARAVARVAALMSWGRFEADVAVLHPTATMQAAIPLDVAIDHFPTTPLTGGFTDVERTQQVYRELCGKNDWFHFEPSALDAAGIAFDVLDDASLQGGDATDGLLRIREQAYSTVVLPSAPFLEEDSARALVRLMDAGGRVVVVGEGPRWATGRGGNDAAAAAVLHHPRCTVVDDVPAAVAALPADAQYARSGTPLLVRRDGGTSIALVGGAYPSASAYPRRAGAQGRWTDDDFDRSRYAREHAVTVRAEVAGAQVWNPATGERRAAPVAVAADGTSTITVETGGAPMVLLTWQDGPAGAQAGPTPPAAGEVLDISDGWTGELVPTLDNTWGDLARPVGADLSDLQVWAMSTREQHTGAWQETTATFGQRVLVHRPAAPADLPAPLDPAQCAEVAAGAALGTGPGWTRHEYSASRGVRRDHAGALGTKGRVPVEHVLTPDPGAGRQVVVRALVVTDHRGPADLVLTTSAPAQVWWNGARLLAPAGETYVTVSGVDVDREVNVVEYRLGASATVDLMGGDAPLGSALTLTPPGGYTPRPEYMASDLSGAGDGTITFTATVPDAGAVSCAQLVVGAATAATVLVDGTALARQEKVEYYESQRGADPAFFAHDLTGRVRGGQTLTVALATTDPDDVVYVDLAVTGSAGTRTLVSGGSGWTSATAGRRGCVRTRAGQWSPLESAYAVSRPHPLPGADWLNGRPQVGEPVLDLHVTDSASPARQEFRVALPAGTCEVTVPLLVDAGCAIDGVPVPVEKGVITLDAPLPAPATLDVVTEATAVRRGGAAWAGPALVRHAPAPIALGDWRAIGLGSWSGAVRYRRTVELPAGRPWTLDLGDLRGSVDVRVDGELVAEAFCAPFRWALPPADGPVDLDITVAGTLGPFLHESTPTTWVFPAQLASGLFGPVTVHVD